MNESSLSQQSFLKAHKRHIRMVSFLRLLVLIGFLGIWEGATRGNLLDAFIFSSPSRILNTFFHMVQDKSIFRHMGVTLSETFLSFFLVIFFGLFITILLWMSKSLSEILEPYLVALNSLPKSALAPLLIVWLGATMKTIVIAGMSVALFGTIISLYSGFKEVDKDKLKLIQTLHGKKKDMLMKVVLPSSIPTLISTMKINIGLCLVGVVIGEFLAARSGLGYLIIYGSQVFKLDWVMMSIIILCIIAMGLYKLIHLIEKFYIKKL